MRTQILTPLLRSTVGFDRFDRLFDAVNRADRVNNSYPPHNIEKIGENAYRISMAVAGFTEDELDITQRENQLVITGTAKPRDTEDTYLHRGIARRNCERRFDLDDTSEVTGARLDHGLLHVELVREIPEAQRPRQIGITAGPAKPAVEDQDKVAA